jgi:phage gpG-like protein
MKIFEMDTEALTESEEKIVSYVESTLPEFSAMVKNIKKEGLKTIETHQDSFAVDYSSKEIALLGCAVKYAGLHGIRLMFHGTNRETCEQNNNVNEEKSSS